MLKAYYVIPAAGQFQVRCGDYTGTDVLLKTCKRVETAERFAEQKRPHDRAKNFTRAGVAGVFQAAGGENRFRMDGKHRAG